LVGRETHSFDDPHVAPYWPTWLCSIKIGVSDYPSTKFFSLSGPPRDVYHGKKRSTCTKNRNQNLAIKRKKCSRRSRQASSLLILRLEELQQVSQIVMIQSYRLQHNSKRVSKKGREVEDVVRHMTDSCEFIDSHSFQGRLRSSRVSKINEKKSF